MKGQLVFFFLPIQWVSNCFGYLSVSPCSKVCYEKALLTRWQYFHVDISQPKNCHVTDIFTGCFRLKWRGQSEVYCSLLCTEILIMWLVTVTLTFYRVCCQPLLGNCDMGKVNKESQLHLWLHGMFSPLFPCSTPCITFVCTAEANEKNKKKALPASRRLREGLSDHWLFFFHEMQLAFVLRPDVWWLSFGDLKDWISLPLKLLKTLTVFWKKVTMNLMKRKILWQFCFSHYNGNYPGKHRTQINPPVCHSNQNKSILFINVNQGKTACLDTPTWLEYPDIIYSHDINLFHVSFKSLDNHHYAEWNQNIIIFSTLVFLHVFRYDYPHAWEESIRGHIGPPPLEIQSGSTN